MKYTLKITGGVSLVAEGTDKPVTYELMFDHMTLESDGLGAEDVARAVSVGVMNAMVGRPKTMDSVERNYPREADEFAGSQAMALLAASVALADGDIAKAGEALATGHLRLDLDAAQVQYVSGHLHSHGVVPDWATAQADIEGVEIPEDFR